MSNLLLDDSKIFTFDDNQHDDSEITITVQTDEIFVDEKYILENYNAGIYILEVRAWADNDYDTGIF